MSSEVLIAHPTSEGRGSAMSMVLHPADKGSLGFIECWLAKQVCTGLSPSRFDWENCLRVRLYAIGLAEMCMVFRGMKERACIGKGRGSVNVRFSHRIEPIAGYLLEATDLEGSSACIMLTQPEAVFLSLAIEASMGVLAFGEGGNE